MMTAPIVPTACVVAYDLSSGSAHPVARAAPSEPASPQLTKKHPVITEMSTAISTSR